VIIASRGEAEAITGISDPEKAIAELAKRGQEVVIVTQGHQGALTFDHGEIFRTPPFPVVEVVDTTGAGDAFTSGIVVGMLDGLSWEETARLGCAVASIKVGCNGARGGLPNRWQVQQLLSALNK
jgi:sugar/nucleoside kinase (ribokinase family)